MDMCETYVQDTRPGFSSLFSSYQLETPMMKLIWKLYIEDDSYSISQNT